jgi:hypothetical protein
MIVAASSNHNYFVNIIACICILSSRKFRLCYIARSPSAAESSQYTRRYRYVLPVFQRDLQHYTGLQCHWVLSCVISVIAAIWFTCTPISQLIFGYAADIFVRSAAVTGNFDECN